MAKPAKVAAVLDRGGAIDFVTPGQLGKLIKAGAGRAATARDLGVAGVELPDGVTLVGPADELVDE